MLKVRLSQFLQIRVNFLIFSILPLRLSLLYLKTLGWLYYGLLNRKERKKIERNISMVFQKMLTSRQIKSLTRKTISNTFRHYAEKLFQTCRFYRNWVKYIQADVEFKGLEALDRAVEEGKGVLLVTGHFGALEFLPTSLNFKGYNLVVMAKFKTEKLKLLSRKRADRIGLSIIDCQNHPAPIMASIECLKNGKILIAECDEIDSWRPFPDRRTTTFLGHSVVVDKTIDLVVKKSGCAVITAYVRRDEKDRYSLILKEMAHPVNGESIGEVLLKSLEEYVYTYPEQWYHWVKFDAMLEDKGAPPCESPTQPSIALESLYVYK